MDIREYRISDRREVAELWGQVFPASAVHNNPYDVIDRKFATRDGLFFVATLENRVIGTVLAGYDGHRGWLYRLAVSTNQRRSGIGTALVRYAETRLARRGCLKVNLQVRVNNTEVVRFYESLGFHCEERISMGKIIDE
tara:strand:+ start:89162 stop:89578 length:417 start_codon:yes stop_codon:yes gene_type:complete